MNTHFLRYMDMCKCQRVIPRHKQSPRYRIAHGWKDEYGSWSWIPFKLLMHLKSQRALFIYFFSSSLNIHIFFLFSFSFFLSFFSFILFFFFFYTPPWTLDYIVPTFWQLPPMLRRLHIHGQRGGKKFCAKVGTKSSIFSWRKTLEIF
jgi:hypothetical protein